MNVLPPLHELIAALKDQASSIVPSDAKEEHYVLLLWSDSLRVVADRIAQLETENAAHLTRIAELESQLAAEKGGK